MALRCLTARSAVLLCSRPLGPTLSEAAVLASGLDLQAPVRSILGDGFGSRYILDIFYFLH